MESHFHLFHNRQVRTNLGNAKLNIAMFQGCPIALFQSRYSFRPSHRSRNVARQTMCQSCDCNVTADVWLACHVSILLECARSMRSTELCTAFELQVPRVKLTHRWVSIFRRVFERECVVRRRLVRRVWPGEKRKVHWVSFWVMVVMRTVCECRLSLRASSDWTIGVASLGFTRRAGLHRF